MRWLLGCMGVAFVIFGGCVVAVLSDIAVTTEDMVFVAGGALIVLLGIWLLYKAVTMQRTPPAGDQREPGSGPPRPSA